VESAKTKSAHASAVNAGVFTSDKPFLRNARPEARVAWNVGRATLPPC
jgi:hypothetical protein